MTGRANQKLRTRNAIVAAATALGSNGREVTMPEVARAALVSEATAYRYFPDLASLLREAIAGQLPTTADVLEAVAGRPDPAARIAAATEFLLRHVLSRQGVVRALIATTITRPGRPHARPGLRFGLIDHALAPPGGSPGAAGPAAWHSSSAISRLSSAPRRCSASPTCTALTPRKPSPASSTPRRPSPAPRIRGFHNVIPPVWSMLHGYIHYPVSG
jgi:AcrR family transcriptional regulator